MNVEKEYAQEFDSCVNKCAQLLEDSLQSFTRKQKFKAFLIGIGMAVGLFSRHSYNLKIISLDNFFEG